MHDLLGTYEVVADEENRVTLPESFRGKLPQELLISGLPEGFLMVCDPLKREGALIDAPNVRTRLLILDALGGLLIPEPLLVHANLDDGQLGWAMWFPNRVEIWEKQRWNVYSEELAAPFRVRGIPFN